MLHRIKLDIAALAFVVFVVFPLWAQNDFSNELNEPEVSLSSGLFDLDLGVVNPLDAMPNQVTGMFEVSSHPKINYDVWLSVPEANLDSVHQVYLAQNGKFSIPLNAALTGRMVNANPVENQIKNPNKGRPYSGDPLDGDNVQGGLLKDIYQVTLTENINLQDVYSEIPEGKYRLRLMVHVSLN